MGDPAGIGGELILKSLATICKKTIPVIIGDRIHIDEITERLSGHTHVPFKRLNEGSPGDVELVDLALIDSVEFGVSDPRYGHAAYRYIMEALNLISLGKVQAIVTCPINKKSIHLAGVPFPGHTELLADYSGITDFVMMMANRRMRVSLATIHIPLREVPGAISVEKLCKCISITHASLKDCFGIGSPLIKVCGLNPHAGEGGIIGDEEGIIQGAIDLAKSLKMRVEGPFPADTLFHKVDCDAFVAMYHDQGLIPVKTMDFRRTVNITLGLPFVRTSPGHGTGFDIAGKGIADPSGLIEAYKVAEKMSSKASSRNSLTKEGP